MIFYLLAAVLVTFPLILHLPDVLLGHPDNDVWNHVWGFWWVKRRLLEQLELPLFTSLLAWPQGGRLYFIDPLNALLSIPLQLLFGLNTAYNLTLLLELALAGWATHRLALEAGASRRAAYLAGLSIVVSPILRCEMHNGITETGNVGWLAMSIGSTLVALRTARPREAARAGLLLGVAFVACWYYGLAAGLVAVLLVALRTPWRGLRWPSLRKHGRTAAAFVIPALLVAGPFLSAFAWTLAGEHSIITRPPTMSRFLIRHNATDLLGFFMPGDYHRPDLWGDYEERFLHTTYLGFGVLALSLLAFRLRAARDWLIIGGLFAVLALGPYLFVGGRFTTVGGHLVPLPFAAISYGLGVAAITHPARMAVVTILCLAVVAALGYDRLEARFPRFAPVLAPLAGAILALEALLVAPAPFPITLAPIPSRPVSELLSADPKPGAVLDLPARQFNTMATSRYLYEQTRHRRPIPYVVHVRVEATPGLKGSPLHDYLVMLANEEVRGRVEQAIARMPVEALRAALAGDGRRSGFRYVVLHRHLLDGPFGGWLYRRFLDRLLGPPLSTPDAWVYRIEGPLNETSSPAGDPGPAPDPAPGGAPGTPSLEPVEAVHVR